MLNFPLKHKTVYLERKLRKYLRNMKKPELLHMTPQGATIHSYDIEGGKTTFGRFLACYMGSCNFYSTMKEATKYVYKF